MHGKSVLVMAGIAALLCRCGGSPAVKNAGAPQQAQLFVQLPDFAVTPDGMAVAPDGDLLLACPNFASYPKGATRPGVPARFVKIGKDRKVRDLFECPILAETGRACPM